MKDLIELQLNKKHADDIVFLCGAGISLSPPTNLPTVNKFIRSIVENCIKDKKDSADLIDKIWDATNRDENPVRARFELLIDFIRKNFDYNLDISTIFSSEYFNKNHYFLSRMIELGASVITTNFDYCIENSMQNKSALNKYIFKGLVSDLPEVPTLSNNLIKIHGSIEQEERTSLVITLTALAKTNNGFYRFPKWRNYLLQLIEGKTLVVLGYSGSDDFDITPILLDANPKKCIWLDFADSGDLPVKVSPKEVGLSNSVLLNIKNIEFYKGNPTVLGGAMLHEELQQSPMLNQDNDSIGSYLKTNFDTPLRQKELINTLLFHYELHSEVLNRNTKAESDLIFFQQIQCLYRKGDHRAVCNRMNDFSKWRHKEISDFDDYLITDLLFHYSASLFYIGEADSAKKQAHKMLEIARKFKNYPAQMDALTHLAAIYFNEWEHEKAGQYYGEALKLQEKAPSVENEARVLWGLADLLSMQEKDEEALKNYLRALEIYTNIGSNYGKAYLELNIGIIYFKQDKLSIAEEYLLASEMRYRSLFQGETKSNHGIVYPLYNLSKTYVKQQKFQQAYKKILEALKYLHDCIGHPMYYEVIILHFYLILKQKGYADAKKRLAHLQKSMEILSVPSDSFPEKCFQIIQQLLKYPSSTNIDLTILEYEAFLNQSKW